MHRSMMSDMEKKAFNGSVIEFEGSIPPSGYFLSLPREIRNQIYCLLFLSDNGTIYPSKSRARPASDAINLLRANRQIYSEAVEILYGQNMFQIRGDPTFMAPQLLNLLVSQSRKDFIRYSLKPSTVCLARHNLKRLSIPSHGISLSRLKQIFSLLQHFPKLEHIQVIYLGKRDVNDMEIVNTCRLLRDRRPLLSSFILQRRVTYSKAVDISWMVRERPYTKWSAVSDAVSSSEQPAYGKQNQTWVNEFGDKRQALLVDAPQSLPE